MRHIGFEADSLDPGDPQTFELAHVDLSLRHVGDHALVWKTFRGLLELRRAHPAFGHASRQGNFADVPIAGVLRIERSAQDDLHQAVTWCNFGTGPANVKLPEYRAIWTKLADSAEPELGGAGPLLPAELAGGVAVELGPSGFCVYGS